MLIPVRASVFGPFDGDEVAGRVVAVVAGTVAGAVAGTVVAGGAVVTVVAGTVVAVVRAVEGGVVGTLEVGTEVAGENVMAGVLEGWLDFFTKLGLMATMIPMIRTPPTMPASNARSAARGESIQASLGSLRHPLG